MTRDPIDRSGMMTLIDLSHPISEGMPVYPGTEPPVIVAGTTVAEDGFFERKITMYTHTGTHMDAPAHLIENGRTLDAYPVGHFLGEAMVLNVSGTGGGTIGSEEIEPHLESVEQVDFLLIRTGWSRYWGTDRYLVGFPVLSIEAAEALAGSGLRGIGFDAISPDPVESTDLPVHRVLMKSELVLIENLNGLDRLPSSRFMFSCFPLPFRDADGSPVRAVAHLPQE